MLTGSQEFLLCRKTTADSGRSPRSPNKSSSSSPIGMTTSTSACVQIGVMKVVLFIMVESTSHSQPYSPASSTKVLEAAGSMSVWLAKAAHSSDEKLVGVDVEGEDTAGGAGCWCLVLVVEWL